VCSSDLELMHHLKSFCRYLKALPSYVRQKGIVLM
jgi:hypothetical protein